MIARKAVLVSYLLQSMKRGRTQQCPKNELVGISNNIGFVSISKLASVLRVRSAQVRKLVSFGLVRLRCVSSRGTRKARIRSWLRCENR